MLLFQKLVDESQLPKPQEYTDTFILTKKLFLVVLLLVFKIYQNRSKDPVQYIYKKSCTQTHKFLYVTLVTGVI